MRNYNDKPKHIDNYLSLELAIKCYLRASAKRQKLNIKPGVLADEKRLCEELQKVEEY